MVSALVHLGLLLLLLVPLSYGGLVVPIDQGAGGPGPAGGGGGRSGGRMEVIQYVRVVPAPPPAPVKPTIQFTPPPLQPVPPPQLEPIKAVVPIVAVGSSSGSAPDPAGGSGPGSGGGVGSGIGTGRGSAIGPGTGGGNQPNFPPTPTELFIPPLPVPASVRGFHVIAEFDVDEKGRVLSMTFTETNDRGYNRRLAEVLKSFRFRPGTRPDGTPIRMKAQVTIDLP